ncbi:Aspartic protease [Phytophthora megakarya]|uniref:Aspartic protease n=1 Tax=Phytophthora megakarya TaxID=4795 RepID=A0A225X046_9STRA|nr:Aspartic protease [Phytophthora megakarya]
MLHDEPFSLDIRQSFSGLPLPLGPEGKPEYKLNPGERIIANKERRQCATAHGAVNNFRTQILLDTGASHLRPGEHANVVIRYGLCRPLQGVVWAERGDQWIIQIVYGARSWAVAIKVVNLSDGGCWIEPRTPVSRIAEYGDIPIVGQFVRPGLRRYMGWQQIIQENTFSAKARVRQEAYEQMLRDAAPPALLVRPREPERAQVTKVVEEFQPQGSIDVMEYAGDTALGAYSLSVIGSLMAVEVSPDDVTLDVNAQGSGDVVISEP